MPLSVTMQCSDNNSAEFTINTARVREEFWRGREQFKKGDTYGVEVERGIDIALVRSATLDCLSLPNS